MEKKTSKKVQFMLSDFDRKEMAPQRKILVIDDQITNHDIIDGFLTVLGFKDCKNNTMYSQNGFKAIEHIQECLQDR